MSDLKLYTKCCKPLGSRKCSKNLRNVVQWMQKKKSSLSINQKICDSCRKALEKTSDEVILPESLAPVDTLDESGDDTDGESFVNDSPYISKIATINSLNKFLVEAGLPEIDTKRLSQKNYCETAVSAISGSLKTLIFRGHPTESDADKSGIDVINQLKDKFRSSTSKSEKTTILTLAPRNWSINRTKSEFIGIQFCAFCVVRVCSALCVLSLSLFLCSVFM